MVPGGCLSLQFKILKGITFWSGARKFCESAFSIQIPTFFPPQSFHWVPGASNLLAFPNLTVHWSICWVFQKWGFLRLGFCFTGADSDGKSPLTRASAIRKNYRQRKIHTNLRLILLTDQVPSLVDATCAETTSLHHSAAPNLLSEHSWRHFLVRCRRLSHQDGSLALPRVTVPGCPTAQGRDYTSERRAWPHKIPSAGRDLSLVSFSTDAGRRLSGAPVSFSAQLPQGRGSHHLLLGHLGFLDAGRCVWQHLCYSILVAKTGNKRNKCWHSHTMECHIVGPWMRNPCAQKSNHVLRYFISETWAICGFQHGQ